ADEGVMVAERLDVLDLDQVVIFHGGLPAPVHRSPRSPPPLRVTFSSTSRPRSRGGARRCRGPAIRRRSTAARQHELVPRLAWIRVTALGPGATSLQNLESHVGGGLAQDLLVRTVASPTTRRRPRPREHRAFRRLACCPPHAPLAPCSRPGYLRGR